MAQRYNFVPEQIEDTWLVDHVSAISSTCLRVCLSDPEDSTNIEMIDLEFSQGSAEERVPRTMRRNWKTYADLNASGVLGSIAARQIVMPAQ
ncbi:hypothetical protein [Halomonas denitrificans]|uniref:hypothetical protein n=1 Tax=Halomonas denitrificans TaxID=370769 RepID=UPI001C99566E|nr:hypothetical protein [Halomonas denitrificans]MBY5969884.1 hypothetical protein [Halomonas denitrificans]